MVNLTQDLWESMTRAFADKARLDPDATLEEIVGQVIIDTALVLDGTVKVEAFT